jgi:MFS family permease
MCSRWTSTAPPLRSASPRAQLATASVAVALASADTYVVVVALPDMMAGVGLGIDELQRATPIISGFLLGYVAVLPLIGRLSDLVSRQAILLSCLAVFVVGSAITAVSVELPVLVGGRVLQGVGGGGLVPAALALVADLWPADRRGVPLGVVGAVQELGSVLGPLLGAAVLAVAGWRSIFWLNVVLGTVLAAVLVLTAGRGTLPHLRLLPTALGLTTLAAGMLTLVAPAVLVNGVTLGIPFVPFAGTSRLATPVGVVTLVLLLATVAAMATLGAARSATAASSGGSPVRQVDLFGALCIAVALGSLVLTFATASPQRDVAGPWAWALVPLALVAATAYTWRHLSARDPLVPRGLMVTSRELMVASRELAVTSRGLATASRWLALTRGGARITRLVPALLVSLLVGVALVAIVVDIPLFARLTVTGSQTVAALVLVRFLVAVPVGALAGGWLLRRFAPAALATTGLILAGGGLVIMSGWGHGSLQSWSATVVLMAVGLGLGLAIAPVSSAALASAPGDAHGVVSSLVVLARMVGMVVGLGLLTAIGLHRYYGTVAALPDQSDTAALAAAGVVQVQTVFLGGAVAAFAAAVVALLLGTSQTGQISWRQAASQNIHS